jgi:hypothetical protein
MTYTAHCLCAGIQFRIEGALEPIQICHCSQCRRAQGAAFAANIPVAEVNVVFEKGTELMSVYESSPGKKRVFCRRCGSPLYSCRDTVPGVLRIRAGLIDDPIPARPAFHAYTAHKASWWRIDDDVPQFPEGYTGP